jgi:hypothetical protein
MKICVVQNRRISFLEIMHVARKRFQMESTAIRNSNVEIHRSPTSIQMRFHLFEKPIVTVKLSTQTDRTEWFETELALAGYMMIMCLTCKIRNAK